MNYSISAEEGNVATSLESFLSGTNAPYIAELYARFLENPKLVDKTWEIFFTDLSDDLEAVLNEMGGASWAASVEHIIGYNGHIIAEELSTSLEQKNVGERDQGSYKVDIGLPTMANGLDGRMAADKIRQATQDSISALMMVRVYRVRGHLNANFDPLGLEGKALHPELDPKTYGFHEEDMDRPIFINNVLGMETATPREILKILQKTYCSSIGVEFMHIEKAEERSWIQKRIEGARNQTEFTFKGKRAIYQRLVEAEGFEPEILNGLKKYISYVEYITVDCGFERGIKQSSTIAECSNYLISRNFKMIDFDSSRIVCLFKNLNVKVNQ